ncbi:MAG: 16S rRNA (uracil(1498)-N(3))-methyltransferase [Gammaproteobacteria bacterium]|nr:16S rRNA (uracil(1498)-N(3))-methyltransferase [Gammaproteobacteria bacterium]
MRIPRIYTPQPLHAGDKITLDENAFSHAVRVLRLDAGDALTLFNGQGGEYTAVLIEANRKLAVAEVQSFSNREVESPLNISLGQCISRGEKMDYTIQKAVELGVTAITPLFSERCGVRLDTERMERKLEHWQSIVVGACEQSGRNRVPMVHPPQALTDWLATCPPGLRLVLSPTATATLHDLATPNAPLSLLLGPEGGLTNAEIDTAIKSGFSGIRLGPRVLRTETAAVATLSAIQTLWGDLGA